MKQSFSGARYPSLVGSLLPIRFGPIQSNSKLDAIPTSSIWQIRFDNDFLLCANVARPDSIPFGIPIIGYRREALEIIMTIYQVRSCMVVHAMIRVQMPVCRSEIES